MALDMCLCIASAFQVRGWLKYYHYFVNILSSDLFWRLRSHGFLFLCFWYLVLLWCFCLVTSQTTSLHHLGVPHSSAALSQLTCIPSRILLLCSLRIFPVSRHFPTHKITVGVLWDSYCSSFHIFHIRTTASVLLIWYCSSAHWMFESTQKSLRAQGKSYNCGINAIYCSDLLLSKKKKKKAWGKLYLSPNSRSALEILYTATTSSFQFQSQSDLVCEENKCIPLPGSWFLHQNKTWHHMAVHTSADDTACSEHRLFLGWPVVLGCRFITVPRSHTCTPWYFWLQCFCASTFPLAHCLLYLLQCAHSP